MNFNDYILIGGFLSIFLSVVFVLAVLIYIAYMFIPGFRAWCDKQTEGLSDYWEED